MTFHLVMLVKFVRDGKVVHPMLTKKKPGKKSAGKAKKPASKPKPKGK